MTCDLCFVPAVPFFGHSLKFQDFGRWTGRFKLFWVFSGFWVFCVMITDLREGMQKSQFILLNQPFRGTTKKAR